MCQEIGVDKINKMNSWCIDQRQMDYWTDEQREKLNTELYQSFIDCWD